VGACGQPDEPMSEPSTPSIRWLHFSDPHLRDPRGAGDQGDQGEVLTAFLKFCHKPMRERCGFRPDFVFISGDLAFSGTREDYQGTGERTVRNFLDVLRRATGLDAQRIHVVPGNHDVNRANIGKDTARGDLQIVALGRAKEPGERIFREVSERLYPESREDLEDRDRSLRRHEEYAAFCRSYWPARFAPPPDPATLGDQVLPVLVHAERLVVPGSTYHFGLAGLCSSWASQSAHRAQGLEDEPRTQFVCTKAVQDCLGALEDEPFRIALLHHPPEWLLAEEEEWLASEVGLFNQVDLVLTGHAHETGDFFGPLLPGRRALHCSAGSLYDGAARNNAFNLVEVWPEERRGRRLLVRWQSGSTAWEPDTVAGGQPDWIEFDWPRPGDAPGGIRTVRAAREAAELSAYCAHMLEGLTVGVVADTEHRCGIDRLYVEPPASSLGSSGLADLARSDESGQAEQRSLPQPRPIRLGEALRDHSVSVLVGAPGTGKTTTLGWLATRAAEQHVRPDGSPPPELAWLSGLVPILISARDLVERADPAEGDPSASSPEPGEWLFRHLRATAEDSRAGGRAEACVRRAVRDGKALLLVDGIDEVPAEERRRIIESTRQLSGCRFVFATRPGGYDLAEHAVGTGEFVLSSWDRERMEAYLDRWFAWRSEWSDPPLSESEVRERRDELLGAFRERQAVRSLAKCPLLLAALVSLEELDGHLPEHRAELCDRLAGLLLEHATEVVRDPKGSASAPALPELGEVIGRRNLAEWRPVFDTVAYRLFVDREELNPAVERAAMVALLGRAIEAREQAVGLTPADVTARANALLDLFKRRPSLLVEEAPDRFAFVHGAFQQYLTARYLREAPPDARATWESLLVYHADEPRWREVIRLTARELARNPGMLDPERLNRLMDGLALRLTGPEASQANWLEIADTVVGCLEDLGNREFPSILSVTDELIARATARQNTLRSWESSPGELGLALRLPFCLARRGLLLSVASADLASACFAAMSSADVAVEDVWPAMRTFSQVRGSADRQSLEHVFEYFANFGSLDQRFMARAVLGKWQKRAVAADVFALAADLDFEGADRQRSLDLSPADVSAWQSAIREVEHEPRLFAAVAMVKEPLSVWGAADYARATVRAFASETSRRSALRVMRGLLTEPAARSTALLMLEEGLRDDDRTIGIVSAFLLAEQRVLSAEPGARAAVRALSADGTREAGLHVLRELLSGEDEAARRAALGALKDGLLGGDFNTAVTSALLLANDSTLPPEQRAQAALRSISAASSREGGVRAMRALLGAEETRPVALAALEEGLRDGDWDIAAISASLLAEEKALPEEAGASAAVRAFQGESSRAVGTKVIRDLLGAETTRPVALAALEAGLGDEVPDIAVTSVSLLAEENALPPEAGSRAAVRGMRGERSRAAALRQVRDLLAAEATRPIALGALVAGLGDGDPEVAGSSVSLLDEIQELPPEIGAWAAVRAFRAESGTRANAVRVVGNLIREEATRPAALAALEEGLDDGDPEIAAISATLLAEEPGLAPEQRARAAARILSSGAGRDTGMRVIRALVADDATRPAALAALEEALGDGDWDIAGASAALLAETRALPTEQRARAAVRALSAESSREAGVRVMRELLAEIATRPSALTALEEGMDDGDSDTAITSASLLAEEGALPPEPGARTAVQAFHLGSSREAGVRVMRGLLREDDSRQAALSALEDGLRERDRITAVTCARLLGEQRALAAEQGARVALRAFAAESSREAGVRVMLGLLADPSARRAALMALYVGERDKDAETAGISSALVAGQRAADA
jgi:hypothetical protein